MPKEIWPLVRTGLIFSVRKQVFPPGVSANTLGQMDHPVFVEPPEWEYQAEMRYAISRPESL